MWNQYNNIEAAATGKPCHSFLLSVVPLLMALWVCSERLRLTLYKQLYPPLAGLHNTQGNLYMADQ